MGSQTMQVDQSARVICLLSRRITWSWRPRAVPQGRYCRRRALHATTITPQGHKIAIGPIQRARRSLKFDTVMAMQSRISLRGTGCISHKSSSMRSTKTMLSPRLYPNRLLCAHKARTVFMGIPGENGRVGRTPLHRAFS